ncbi:MAG: 2,3-bisphosphoglycerate-independent phosphoglycerate mutase [Actinomycetota bacterium]|nr:2,3-bisphosphoglycerate-independent phosphoglycerate mutase [Actinomycetota bacterium]
MTFDLSGLLHEGVSTKILFVVLDGLGGYADAEHGSELEEAATPNLDRLAAAGAVGLHESVAPGITPGSGPSHLALFGYDPVAYNLGRGVLSAAGLDVKLSEGDVAARANLATLDDQGRVTDRRAGRIPDAEAAEVVSLLSQRVSIDGVEVSFTPESQHRVLVVLRGDGLSPEVTDTDPQALGVAPLAPEPRPGLAGEAKTAAQRTAEVLGELDRQVRDALRDHPKANVLLLRGYDSHRELPSMADRYGLMPLAVAIYPMYLGLARLVGMEALQASTIDGQLTLLADHWINFDFFFFHYKATDAAGEDGNFDAKVAAIETFDAVVPELTALEPDVLVVTGDHATPSQMAAHSWHPVPVLLSGARVGRDDVTRFGERWCAAGGFGRRPATDIMPLVLAAAGRLAKYGA